MPTGWPLPTTPFELACRAGLASLNAALNLTLWTAIAPFGIVPGVVVAGLGLGAAVPAVSRRRGVQRALGWGGWIAPMAWPATAVGLLLFVVNLGPALRAGGRRAVRLDVPGLSAHEAAHTLNVAAFGWIFHLLNAIDENVPPLARGLRAYAELVAESRRPRAGVPWIALWS